jgi:hypothetical protein
VQDPLSHRARRFRAPLVRWCFGLCVALGATLVWGAAGCGQIDGGSEAFPGTTVYESPGQTYHLRFLEPPWVPVTLQSETTFLVPSSALSVSATADESDALYSLHVSSQPGNALSAFQTSASAQSPPWNLNTKQTITAVGGQSGLDISWQESESVFHREAHIDGATTASSFELLFTGRKPLADDTMILQMIVSFGPGPAGGN